MPSSPRGGGLWRLKSWAQSRKSFWAAAMALLVLAGVLGSVLGARAVARSNVDRARLAFHLSSAEIASTLRLALQHEEDLVVSASGFVTGNPNASAGDFDRWAESVHAMQRYPELQDFGFVTLVPASQMAAFKARVAANPIRPLGPNSVGPRESFQILPTGKRPYYCLAVAGLARNAASYVPEGLDYCALAPALITTRDSAQTGYAPVLAGDTTTLGVETPVYRGGVVPATASARQRTFMGWIGETLTPTVVLEQALEGHPNVAVIFRYNSRGSHVAFAYGSAPAGTQSTTIDLKVGREAGLPGSHEGWTVQSFGAVVAGGVLANLNSLMLLIAGTLLSVVLGLLVLVLGTGRMRALSLVREKTGELSQKNLELSQRNREVSHQASHDALTGLPNRALVLDRAKQMLARVARQPGMVVGALYVDIDCFKHVNDNFGHAAGDQLLRVVGERLKSVARGQDTVGRLSGDEFVVLVESTTDEATLDLLADRLTAILREPVELDDGREIFSMTASIGVAARQGGTPDALLRDADLALYAAKAAGKNRYALFEADMSAGVEDRLELEADLSAALQHEQFFLLYQPIVDLPSRKIVGVEALIRWQHPARGVLLPDSFIPLAEESGMILPIGRWVLDEVCRQAGVWAAEGLGIGVSVNASAYQLGQDGFTEDVGRVLGEFEVEPSSLTLEITETALMRNVPEACERLKEIRALGVRVAIDDFGTGYASLSSLQRMPVDILKIDMSFVAALSKGGEGRALLGAVLGIGQALSLAVVAEGVETQSQLSTLEEMGCNMAQGFLTGRPSPAAVIEGLLDRSEPPRAIGSPLV